MAAVDTIFRTSSHVRSRPPIPLVRPEVKISDVLSAGEQIAGRLRALSDSIGPDHIEGQFYRRVRVKTSQSLREKVRRKQSGGTFGGIKVDPRPLYTFRDLTDIVGFRIVTLYDEDIKLAIHHVLELVRAGQQQDERLFVGGNIWDAFKEAHFYLRSKAPDQGIYKTCYDLVGKCIREDCAGQPNLDSILENVRIFHPDGNTQQYSSAHFIFNAIGHSTRKAFIVPVEFQIRTAMEDIWSEVNHKLLYKIENQYVWNRDFHTYYKIAKQTSDNLKNIADSFPGLIQPFYEASQNASAQLATFNNPGVDQHFSLVIALFSNIGTRSIEPFQNDFREFEAVIKELQKPRNSEKSSLFRQAINIVQGIRQKVVSIQADTPSETPEHELCSQRIHLCDLEILRLRILMAVVSRHKLEGVDRLVSLQGQSDAQLLAWHRHCADLYHALCDYRASDDLKVRPVAMLHYWKFYLAQTFDSKVAEQNLQSGYAELSSDRSLPFYSIYRILFPRLIASTMLLEVKERIENLQRLKCEPKTLHGLSASLKSALVQAYGYALEAFRRSQEPHDNRGDLILGSEQGASVIDSQTIVNIYRVFRKTFDISITQSNQVRAQDIKEVLDHIERQDLTGLKRDIRNDIADAIAFVKQHVDADIEQQRSQTE